MSNTVKNLNQTPESYSPKKPAILSMAEDANHAAHELVYTNTKKMIDNVLPWNSPWVGCCEYIKCLTSMILKIEYAAYKDKPFLCYDDLNLKHCTQCGKCNNSNTMLAHRDRVYKSFLPIAGNGLTNAFDPNLKITNPNYTTYGNINQSYNVMNGYIESSFAYAGYLYKKIENTGENKTEILNAIIENTDKDMPVICFFDHEWQLITGYDLETDILYLCDPNEAGHVEKDHWFEKINFVLPITSRNEQKPSITHIFKNTIHIMELDNFNGIPAGFAAYEECIKFLSDYHYFESIDDEILVTNYQEIHNYIGYHAEARGFCGDGYKMMIENEHPDEKLYQLLLKLSGMGWTHHNISWDGWNALKPWPCNAKENAYLLRDQSVRETIIDSVNRMRANDIELIRLIKEYLEE